MHPRGPSAALLLALLILTIGLVAGCGGGEQSEGQTGNGSQDGGPGKAQKQGGEGTSQGAPVPKVAVGTVRKVFTEKRKIIVRPTSPEEGKKPIPFKVKETATITLDDKEAELGDAEKGQGAQITYVVRKEHNVAREVTLISPDGAAGAGGEETG